MNLYLDIETVPGPHCKDAIATMAARREEDPDKFAATSPWLCEIRCISHWDENRGMISLLNGSAHPATTNTDRGERRYFSSEEALLGHFNAGLVYPLHSLITFAGRMFDLPTLYHRSIRNGVKVSHILRDAANEYRFKPDANYDLQEILTFFGATCRRPSLREVCIGYGLPDPKAGGDGGSVKNMSLEDIATYCEGDVMAVIRIHEILLGRRVEKKPKPKDEPVLALKESEVECPF
jgi:hypothetical protein